MHCQRKNLQGEGTWGNQDHFAYALHVLLTPAEHMLRPSFVSLMEPETGGYAVLDDIQDTGSWPLSWRCCFSDKMRFLLWDSCTLPREGWALKVSFPVPSAGWWILALRQVAVQLCPPCSALTRISRTSTCGTMLLETQESSFSVRVFCTPAASFRCSSKSVSLLQGWEYVVAKQERSGLGVWGWDNLYLRSDGVSLGYDSLLGSCDWEEPSFQMV